MITKIYNWLKKKDEDLAFGLISVLAFGLASGLISVLTYGLASGLISGLAFGLAGLIFGLVFGLAFGLASVLAGLIFGLAGLIFGLVFGLINLSQLIPISLASIIILIAAILILAEILYGFNKKEKRIKWSKVIWLKADAILTSLLVIINGLNAIWIFKYIGVNFDIVLEWIGYTLVGLIALVIIGGLIYFLLLWNKKGLTK